LPRVIALHGFLGKPDDFLPLQLPNLFAPDLFAIAPGPLTPWVNRFNRACPDGAVLMGYSLGGRLALHAAIAQPQKFRALIILCAHPGLECAHARAARRVSDALWAKRFLQDPWQQVLSSWNQQPVLRSSAAKMVAEQDITRKDLAHFLRYFSLGEQLHLTAKINELDLPILWLAPKSEAHVLTGLRLKHPLSQLHLFEHGGHRFVFSYPQAVARHVRGFLSLLGN
jgi:2-succinyl-6-hydroxy-2,4-cyclohexadiene-1-carboxylate synthase